MTPDVLTRVAERFDASHDFRLRSHLIVVGRMGSQSHGTYVPPTDPTSIDDQDLMGFVVPPIQYHLGLPRFEHWVAKWDDLDVTLYSLEKAFRLLLNGNPNIVGLLWLRDEDYLWRTPTFEKILARRDLFVSKAAYASFAGYAAGQLHRMTAFDEVRMAEYERLRGMVLATDVELRTVLEADVNKLTHLERQTGLVHADLQRLRKLHREHFSGYMGEKRKAIVRERGFDCKNAAHCIRLLRMAVEFLHTGRLQVYRTQDADELRAIKQGHWTLDECKAEAERLFALAKEARDNSPLADQPNSLEADDLLTTLHCNELGWPL